MFAFYYASKALSWGGTALAVALMIFLATVGYSASELTYEGISFPAARSVGNDIADFNTSVDLANPGYYSLNPFWIVIHLLSNRSVLMGVGSTPLHSVPGGGSTEIPVVLPVDLASPAAQSLLVNNTVLETVIWVNGTYASLFPLHLQLTEQVPWGAPFHGLRYVVGAGEPQPNGTLAFPFNLSFTDDSRLPIVGTLLYRVTSPSGATCGTGSLGIIRLPGQSYSGGTRIYVQPSCGPTAIDFTFESPLMTLELPPEALP